MSIASEPKARGVQVTIKYGRDYDDPWVTFAGMPHEIREDIVEYFDIDRDSVAGVSLSAVVATARNLATAKGTLASTFGATVIRPAQQAKAPSGDVWAEAGRAAQAVQGAKPAEPEVNPLFALIEGTTSVADLQRLWAENQSAFEDKAVMDAWKAKGKQLQGAAR
ncbi:hypothetical protein [Micromonospora sp. CB01531]|uniref:hypothetical protein n=1 Tax=Micromonospora sp. CB01531 TaxID=1718947 RepID=UPI000967EBB7|nr:hypothetical protein [Micromonospora sp. CB01531]OKI45125.1 hypothetical protein A6A27_11980 [Micromonospora sp. CB01531]